MMSPVHESPTARSIIADLATLVGFPTVSGTPNRPLLEWFGEQLIARGAVVEIFPGRVEGCANLLARFGPDVADGLVLSGHTDVVPPGEGWSSDPWTATVDGDTVRGRGTADMKGFFAAVLAALGRCDPASLTHPVHIVASYDEEVGCRGIRDVLAGLAERISEPRLVVVGEPTMMRPRRAGPGKRVYRVSCRSVEAHSSRAAEVPSAITAATEIVLAIDRLNRAAPDTADGVRPYVLNVGTIGGGRQVNVIADRCDVEFEIRHHASCDPDQVLAPLWGTVDEARAVLAGVGGGIEVASLVEYPSLATPADEPALALIERIADAGRSGMIGFGTEGGLLAGALAAPVVVCGPGDIANAHCADEYVSVAQLVRAGDLISSLIDELLR